MESIAVLSHCVLAFYKWSGICNFDAVGKSEDTFLSDPGIPGVRSIRHDICQKFYTSTVSQILKFTWEKARKLRHFSLLIWKFGNFIHIIWLISQYLSIYAHFILNLWLKWLKIPKQSSIISMLIFKEDFSYSNSIFQKLPK